MAPRQEQQMIGLTTCREGLGSQALATLIHDDVLQSLGVAMLGVDLCRRLHRRARYEDALDELTGVVRAAAAALTASDALLPILRRFAPPQTPPAIRPSLVVIVAASSSEGATRPATGPNEIAETLAACALMARRCRHQYDAGLGEDTMAELELLLQRLEFVAITYRALMNDLRSQPETPAPTSALGRTA
jgi:hypothetical protein